MGNLQNHRLIFDLEERKEKAGMCHGQGCTLWALLSISVHSVSMGPGKLTGVQPSSDRQTHAETRAFCTSVGGLGRVVWKSKGLWSLELSSELWGSFCYVKLVTWPWRHGLPVPGPERSAEEWSHHLLWHPDALDHGWGMWSLLVFFCCVCHDFPFALCGWTTDESTWLCLFLEPETGFAVCHPNMCCMAVAPSGASRATSAHKPHGSFRHRLKFT